MQRVALCATTALMGCALIAVMWSSHDAATLVHEDMPAVLVPETEFVDKAAPKKAAKPTAPKKVEYPADKDQGVWSQFSSAKAEAKKKLTKPEFVKIEKACSAIRRASSESCAQLYCAAHATCGEPCPKLYASPPMQVIPLQPGGPQFHKVAEVENKERHNKKLRAELEAAKERAAKEHAEKAKEKAAKEVDFKSRVGLEKAAKEKTTKAAAKKEKSSKDAIQAELVTKEVEVKGKVAAMKAKSVTTCQAEAGTFLAHCEEMKVKESAHKEKVAKKKKSKELSDKAAAKMADHMEKQQKYGTGPYTAGEGSGSGSGLGPMMSQPASKFTGGMSVPGAVVTPLVTKTTAYGETESKCSKLSAVTCITTLGCHLEPDQNKCVEGLGEAVAGGPTPAPPPFIDPIAIAETCVDDENWQNEDGDSCSDITPTQCASHGDDKYPGFACKQDGSDCKTANEACCTCQIVTAGESGCQDSKTWTDGTETCASINTKADSWCPKYGEAITPGKGCKLDGSDCLSANEACCSCKDLVGATPSSGATGSAGATAAFTFDLLEAGMFGKKSRGRRLLQADEFGVSYDDEDTSQEDKVAPMDDDMPEDDMPEEKAQDDMPEEYPEDKPEDSDMVEDKQDDDMPAWFEQVEVSANAPPPPIPTGPASFTVGGDVVPTASAIASVNGATDANMAASDAAMKTSAVAIAADYTKVKAASAAATAAAMAVGSAASLQKVDGAAQKFIGETLIGGFKTDAKGLNSMITNLTKTADAFKGGKHTCPQLTQHNRTACEIQSATNIMVYENTLMKDAAKQNKAFGKKAAAAAAAWGRALKASEKAEATLTKVTAAAEADLKAHVDAQPSFLLEIGAFSSKKGASKCAEAKDAAYMKCRKSQNDAYLSCAGMYKSGIGEYAPSPSGSGSGMAAMVASPMQFEGATVVHTTLVPKDDEDEAEQADTEEDEDQKSLDEFNALLHPKGEEKDEDVHKSEEVQKTSAVDAVDDMFKKFGDTGRNYEDDGLDDSLGGSLEDMDLLQEADESLKEMGFPPLP